MPNHQITWEDAQQMPDDGMRYEAIGREDPAFERFTERVPVPLGAAGGKVLGEVDLEAVFRRA